MDKISTLDELIQVISDTNNMLKKSGIIEKQIQEIMLQYCGFTNPFPLKYNNVEIRESKIHGKGLFATKNIPKNVIITYYPVHATWENNIYKIFDEDPILKKNIVNINNTYSKEIGQDIRIIGNPNNLSNKLLLGHMINDASGNVYENIDFEKMKDIREFKNLIAKYYIDGSKKRNCELVTLNNNKVSCVITTREIKMGEELMTYYDPFYWFQYNYDIKNYDIYDQYCSKLFEDKVFKSWIYQFNNFQLYIYRNGL